MTTTTDCNRRRLLQGLAAGSLAAATGGIGGIASALAQAAPSAKPHRIDVHHHFSPPAWLAEVKGRELLQRANSDWTPARSLEDMDQAGVAAAVVSITNPGLWFGDKAATQRVARACNDYGAKLVGERPSRFGLVAALPLPDVDASLREIETPATRSKPMVCISSPATATSGSATTHSRR